MKFEIKKRDAAGRICKFTTKNGVITTPNLMPVINPNKMIISPKEMRKLFGTEIIITNSYIINKNEKLRKIALEEGVHKLVDFDGAIMTDSGTFQSYVYGDIKIDPIEIVKFQRDIGSDIGTILDIFGTPDQNRDEAEKAVKETIKRAKDSICEKKDMFLACTVQGSLYTDLRKKCAEKLSKLDSDFFPIGGVVPIMENQRYTDLVNCIISSKQGLNPSKPVHLFGAGHPLTFPLAVALGCDFFDSSAYAKYASDGRMIFPWGTEKLDNLSEIPCCCPICSSYNIDELRKLDKKDLVIQLAKHNLYISYSEIKKIRAAISGGWLWELVERRASNNPYLLESLKILEKNEYKVWLEQFEPVSKKRAVFYSGDHTIHRPIISRIHRHLFSRYDSNSKKTVVFPENKKPYSSTYSQQIKEIFKREDVNVLVDSYLGPVPIELDEMYPFAQSVFPEKIDRSTLEFSKDVFERFVEKNNILSWSEYHNYLKNLPSKGDDVNIDFKRIFSVANMQFGKDAAKYLFDGDVKISKSKKTGKIRNIFVDNNHILSMRAHDGLFTLKIKGGYLLHKSVKSPRLRVAVNDDAVSFIKEGKSVFAKFVNECDAFLYPYDECLIVDRKDNLLAVGQCIFNRSEMISFDYGIAVKTRETM